MTRRIRSDQAQLASQVVRGTSSRTERLVFRVDTKTLLHVNVSRHEVELKITQDRPDTDSSFVFLV